MATKSKTPTPIDKKRGLKKKAESDDLVFSLLTKETIEELDKCNDNSSAELTILADVFGLGGWLGDLPSSMQLNMYHNLYIFAKENKMNPTQTSILFSLFKNTLDKLIESSFSSLVPVDDFKTLLIKQLKSEQQGTTPTLTLETCTLITQYMSKSLFQHLNLYKYVFTQDQESGHVVESKRMELPPLTLLSLSDARSAESVMQEQEEERQRLANIDTFDSEIDIFESLSPDEIKKVTAETVAALVDHFQIETEKLMAEQRAKTLVLNQKVVKE